MTSYKSKIYTTLGTPTSLSGEVVSATNSAGVPAKDYTVKGKTIVWNQLLDKSKYPVTTTKNGVTFTNNGDGTITANGTATQDVWLDIILGTPPSLQIGHKMLLIGCPSGGGWSSYLMRLFDSNDDMGNGKIFSANTGSLRLVTFIKSGYVATNLVFKPQLFDLTQMFGAGNEPTTVAQFCAMFPDDYYPYNAGELKTIVPTSIEASSVERFQLVDKSKPYFIGTYVNGGVTWVNNGDGTYSVTGSPVTSTTAIVQKFATDMPAGHVYYLRGIPTAFHVTQDIIMGVYNNGAGVFSAYNQIKTARAAFNEVRIVVVGGYSVSNVLVKPQLFDLTQMFGAGNEPTTPAEFWQKVPEKLYGYNPSAYKSVNIPSSKYFPDGMKSAGSAYDEINFLSQKAIKRIGIRAYQTGDENNTAVMTDKTNTVYELATPVETEITPPLQALHTYKGFTSFSAPNSLTQNGPLSVTYYAEGGTNPEKGWLTSYKRKLYMGRSIEWNQLFTNSRTSSNGVTISNNQDGTMTLNGTANQTYINFTNLSDAMNQVHKYLLYFKVLNNLDNVSLCYGWLNRNGMSTDIISNGESCTICNQTDTLTQGAKSNGLSGFAVGTVFNNVKIAVMVMDLTQMFGAGNEPSTPEEFWSYFDHKLYPYNPGETQPLFKISRKSQWGSATPASLYVGEDIIIPQIVRN